MGGGGGRPPSIAEIIHSQHNTILCNEKETTINELFRQFYWHFQLYVFNVNKSLSVNSIYLPGTITFSHLAVKK